MDIVVWTLAGALAGVLLNMLVRRRALSEVGNVLAGTAALVAGGCLIAPALGLADTGDMNLVGLLVALVCAVVGLSIAHQPAEREDA
jgi:uncharacterized membrane protein YeaQ/YmgE (transglycosylase-associated protein family)